MVSLNPTPTKTAPHDQAASPIFDHSSLSGTKWLSGFPGPDLFDRCAHSGRRSLTLLLAPTLAGYGMCSRGNTAPRYSARHTGPPEQVGSSLPQGRSGRSHGGCSSPACQLRPSMFRVSSSPSLLESYDEPEILWCSNPQICPTGAGVIHKCKQDLRHSNRRTARG